MVTYGTRPRQGRHHLVDHPPDGAASLSVGDRLVRLDLERAGRHTVLNAAGAVSLLSELGHDPDRAAGGVSRYRGVARRFERRGTVRGVTVIDDYAHHPTEIAATLAEARATRPGRVVAVFQPHLYSRTEQLRDRFGHELAAADVVVVTDVYGSREAPRPGVTGGLVANAARRAGAAEVTYVPHLSDLAEAVAGLAIEGDLIVLLGAGDITVVAKELLIALDTGGSR